jgi:5-methylcytosine-specific restriction protein A
MPRQPPRPCTFPGGCPELVDGGGRCAAHAYRGKAGPTWGRGSTRQWRTLRAKVLKAHPICVVCERATATQVDHHVPLSAGGTDDVGNLRAVCDRCHRAKSATERPT